VSVRDCGTGGGRDGLDASRPADAQNGSGGSGDCGEKFRSNPLETIPGVADASGEGESGARLRTDILAQRLSEERWSEVLICRPR
jgi:hypothetical protein